MLGDSGEGSLEVLPGRLDGECVAARSRVSCVGTVAEPPAAVVYDHSTLWVEWLLGLTLGRLDWWWGPRLGRAGCVGASMGVVEVGWEWGGWGVSGLACR